VAIIEGRDLPVQDVIDRMRITAKHPNLYAALAILYMSCNDPTDRLEISVRTLTLQTDTQAYWIQIATSPS